MSNIKSIDELLDAVQGLSIDRPELDLTKLLFGPQLKMVRSPAKRKVVVAGRRGGKTEGCARDLIDQANRTRGVNCVYIAKTRGQAKNIIWNTLLEVLEDNGFRFHANNQELVISLDNRSRIFVGGANDEKQMEKFRGLHFKVIYLDEVQSFPPYIYEFISEVLEPTLIDYDGQLVLVGTPNASCTGALADAWHDKGELRGYEKHHWTMLDNPWIEKKSGKTPQQALAEIRKRKGIRANNPAYQREYLGKWTKSLDDLVYKVGKNNLYETIPNHKDWKYVLGIDLGWEDPSAFVVCAYSPSDKRMFIVDEYKEPHMIVSQVVRKIKEFEKKYNFTYRVIDSGGLGKQITESIIQEHGILLEAAEKTRKLEYIEFFNDHLRTDKIMLKRKSQLHEEYKLLQWDFKSARPREHPDYDNHLTDAALYAFRKCYHYLFKEKDLGFADYGDFLEAELIKRRKEKDSKRRLGKHKERLGRTR